MKKQLFNTSVLFISAFLLALQPVVAAPTNLNQLIKTAVDNNPTLKSRKLAWQSLIHKYKQQTALDDPQLIYSEAVSPIETRLGPQDRVLVLNQKLPFRGKLALKGEVVKKEIEMAKVGYDKASRDLIVNLKKSYYDLVYLENAIKLSLQNKQLLENVSQLSNSNYANNTSTLNDVAKAQSAYAQVSYDVQLLEELRSTEKTNINSLLSRPPEFKFEINSRATVPAKFKHEVSRLYQWAESNEEITLADIEIQKSEVQSRLSNFASLPDFNLGARYTQIGERDIAGLTDNGKDGFAVSIGLNIPLNRSKNKAIKEQAKLMHLKKLKDKKALQNSLRTKVKEVYFKLNNSYRLIELYKNNLIPQANRAMQTSQIQHSENNGSAASYLETQSTWLNFQLAYQRAVADYWKNLTEMEKLTGKKL